MNLTLSVDDRVLERARDVARSMDKSVNQLVREYLEQLAGEAQADADWDEFERLSLESEGDSRGWKFNRDELYERP